MKISEVVQNNGVVLLNKAKHIIQGNEHNATACIAQTIPDNEWMELRNLKRHGDEINTDRCDC